MHRILDSYFNKYSQQTITSAFLRMHQPTLTEDKFGVLQGVGWKYEVWESKEAHDAGAPSIGNGNGTFHDTPEESHEATDEDVKEQRAVNVGDKVVDKRERKDASDNFNESKLNTSGRTAKRQASDMVLERHPQLKGRDV